MSSYVGTKLDDGDEVLRRVVPLGKQKGGMPSRLAFAPDAPQPQPTKSAFIPGTNDHGGLSTHRETTDPVDAYRAYVSPTRGALGTWGVSVSECEELQLNAYFDGGINGNPDDHSTVWFPMPADATRSGLTRVHERIGKELCDCAKRRGHLYRPDDEALSE